MSVKTLGAFVIFGFVISLTSSTSSAKVFKTSNSEMRVAVVTDLLDGPLNFNDFTAAVSIFHAQVRAQLVPLNHLEHGTGAKQLPWLEAHHVWGPLYCRREACATETRQRDEALKRYWKMQEVLGQGSYDVEQKLPKANKALQECQMRDCSPTHDPARDIPEICNRPAETWAKSGVDMSTLDCSVPAVTYKEWFADE